MLGEPFKALLDGAVGASAVGLVRAVKLMDRRRTADFAGALVRKTGPLFKEHRLGRENLRAAFPEKSDAEIEKILAGVWDNLGRLAIEFAHLDELVPTGLDAPVKLARILQSGVHVGMLVDQHYTRGIEVTFFGRPCKVNPLIALLARQTGCAIHGMRVVRQPDGNSFSGEIT